MLYISFLYSKYLSISKTFLTLPLTDTNSSIYAIFAFTETNNKKIFRSEIFFIFL
jgi:hypothetical protein